METFSIKKRSDINGNALKNESKTSKQSIEVQFALKMFCRSQ